MRAGIDERKLTTILVVDAAGYSSILTVADRSGTIELLCECRALIDRLLARHGGHIFDAAGDCVLAEFGSVVAAVQASVDLQLLLRRAQGARPDRIRFRVGVALGDVIVKGENLLGDGANIAERLERLAGPGGIVVAGNVREEVEGKLKVTFDDLGEQALKNIPSPVRALRVVFTDEAMSGLAMAADREPAPY